MDVTLSELFQQIDLIYLGPVLHVTRKNIFMKKQ